MNTHARARTSMTEHFARAPFCSDVIGKRPRNKGLGEYDIAQRREFKRAASNVFRISPYLMFRLSWVPLATAPRAPSCSLSTSDGRGFEYICTRHHLRLFTNKHRKSLCNAFV